ncbi:MAG: queuosine salvage family protein [Opitutaceae bacterium]|nr:queuosine salvage family protein [Opitutaceae bacterium]
MAPGNPQSAVIKTLPVTVGNERCHRCGRGPVPMDAEYRHLCIGCAARWIEARATHDDLAAQGKLTTLQTVRHRAASHFPSTSVRSGPEHAVNAMAAEIRRWIETRRPRYELPNPELLLRELIFNSVNYCYWEGRADHKPAGGGASLMYRLIDGVFREHSTFASRLDAARRQVALAGFPLAGDRLHCLDEFEQARETAIREFLSAIDAEMNIEFMLDWLTTLLPGFGHDPFRKRAVLFFHCCRWRFGLYRQAIALLPAPIDYHIPNILHRHGLLEYAPDLDGIIQRGESITSGSEREWAIRAAAMCRCQDLAARARVTEGDVDACLFRLRKTACGPHHLTVTIDY